tara:strand:+ start:157 stop:990 length:834 start_codon:yes stop_codon:yes gene_type:complete
MPELPEVETVCLALSKILINSKVSNIEIFRKDLRWNIKDNLERDLKQRTLKKPYRRGKYILIPTSNEHILLFHLGMSGTIKIIAEKYDALKHDHVKIDIETKRKKNYSVIYNDPRRFGFIDLLSKKDFKNHFLLKNIGVEPLSKSFTTEYIQKKITKRSTCIKNILMDQSIIAGIGNIYASEILYKAKINPLRSVNTLNRNDLKYIINATKYILNKSISVGGTSIRNHLQPDGKLGYFVQKLQVYGKAKQECFECKNLITSMIISGRSTFFCNTCQK